jgi:predicted dithiol-disulfide oxidoreductase (DUF899 family)
MGWTMPWVSSGATDFNLDFAFFTEDDRRIAATSEDVITSKVVLDISMSLDGLIAQPDDAPGPIHEVFFSGETEHDAIFRTSGATTEVVRESIDAAGAEITRRGWFWDLLLSRQAPTTAPRG